jgi:glycosyltransferase involved in cell wall biosynthesis
MIISGFTFVRNAEKLYIPIKESILSILPICDEFIVALAKSDDNTEAIIRSISSDKIKIIYTDWKVDEYPKNTEFARQTDIAKSHCKGEWLFYLQGDEAIHENDLSKIKNACEVELNNKKVEGFLFNYLHFWGDYEHYHQSHVWYPKEIRIIRNLPEIHSWRDAQSFRKFSSFNGSVEDYLNKTTSEKLHVKKLDVNVFHYGYVRPPELMTAKRKIASATYHGSNQEKDPVLFDYGPLQKLTLFKETHPKVMNDWMAKHHWKHQLQLSGSRNKQRAIHKHEKLKYRLVSWLENTLLFGKQLGGFKNYIEL